MTPPTLDSLVRECIVFPFAISSAESLDIIRHLVEKQGAPSVGVQATTGEKFEVCGSGLSAGYDVTKHQEIALDEDSGKIKQPGYSCTNYHGNFHCMDVEEGMLHPVRLEFEFFGSGVGPDMINTLSIGSERDMTYDGDRKGREQRLVSRIKTGVEAYFAAKQPTVPQ